jgi:hypothetical protein
MNQEHGLYYPDGSFKDIDEIKEKNKKNPHPDKKVRSLDFDRVTRYLQEGRDIVKSFEIGQREATFVPKVEYPELPMFMLLASDLHYGSVNANYEQLIRHLNLINELPNFFLATNGDEVDNFNAVFHAQGMTEDPLPPQIQSRAIAQKLLELDSKGKIAVLSQGNHNRAGFIAGQDWYDSFLSEFECPVFTCGGLLHVNYGDNDYRMVMNHTYWGKSKLNVTNAAKRMMEYEGGGDVDVAWVGHTHQSSYEHFERGGKDVLAVVSGTYKIDDPWAAQNGIGGRGQQPGITIMLSPEQRGMEAFKKIENAADYIVAMTK